LHVHGLFRWVEDLKIADPDEGRSYTGEQAGGFWAVFTENLELVFRVREEGE
jgi:hypothetical protein